jgi:hypothetical protein
MESTTVGPDLCSLQHDRYAAPIAAGSPTRTFVLRSTHSKQLSVGLLRFCFFLTTPAPGAGAHSAAGEAEGEASPSVSSNLVVEEAVSGLQSAMTVSACSGSNGGGGGGAF